MEGDNAILISLDSSNTLDTLSNYHLPVKMKNVGISKKIVNIVRDF